MKAYLITIFVLVLNGHSFSQDADVRKKHFNTKENIALEGFDPVSYFGGKPSKGSPKIAAVYKGVQYQFVSQANLAKFKSSPSKYEPAYGGWCAFAMGESGEKVKIDPETYTILDGKLYVFYNFWGNNTLKDWKKNEHELKQKGDRNWETLIR
jgi:YHS domain-containing protein